MDNQALKIEVFVLKHNLSQETGQEDKEVMRLFASFEAANRVYDEIWTGIRSEDEYITLYPAQLILNDNGEYILNDTLSCVRFDDIFSSVGAALAGKY